MFIITFSECEAPSILAGRVLLYHHIENFEKDLKNGTIITDDILADVNDVLYENYSTVEELMKEEGEDVFESWYYVEEGECCDEL